MNEPCKKINCQCDHSDPCTQGWVFIRYTDTLKRVVRGVIYETTKEYDGVRPCPTCDPERAQIVDTSKTSEELTHKLQQRSQFKVAENYDKSEASKTRTL